MNNKSVSLFASSNKEARKRKIKSGISLTITYTFLILLSIIWLLPFVYLIIQSLAPQYDPGVIIPNVKTWTFDNYIAIFTDPMYPFWTWFKNTFFIAFFTSILQTVLTLMSAYAFSRLRFKSRKAYMKFILIITMFPGFLGMIIVFFILQALGLTKGTNTRYGLILMYIAGSVCNYYIAKGFFDTISTSLDEAAMLDGANKHTIFWKVIMPLSKPIVVYTILLAFVGPWGDYMMASLLTLGNSDSYNVAVGLQQWLTKEQGLTHFPKFCAAGVIVSIPIMSLFFWLQKYYVEGVTGGAVKG